MCNCNNGRKMNSCPSFTANAMLVGDYEEADGNGYHFVERERGGWDVAANATNENPSTDQLSRAIN